MANLGPGNSLFFYPIRRAMRLFFFVVFFTFFILVLPAAGKTEERCRRCYRRYCYRRWIWSWRHFVFFFFFLWQLCARRSRKSSKKRDVGRRSSHRRRRSLQHDIWTSLSWGYSLKYGQRRSAIELISSSLPSFSDLSRFFLTKWTRHAGKGRMGGRGNAPRKILQEEEDATFFIAVLPLIPMPNDMRR